MVHAKLGFATILGAATMTPANFFVNLNEITLLHPHPLNIHFAGTRAHSKVPREARVSLLVTNITHEYQSF